MMFVRFSKALAMVALVGVVAACDDDPAPQIGNLQIEYRIGSGTQTCEDAGIAFVQIDVMQGEVIVQDESVNCDPTNQSVTFTDLEVGEYTVLISGLDSANNEIYRGEASSPITIENGVTTGPETIRLEQIRPSIKIILDFDSAGGCETHSVVDIVVIVYEGGDVVIFDEEFVCTEIFNEESLLIENLSTSSTYDIRIRGTNDLGEYIYQFNADSVEVSAGAPTEIESPLEDCNGICSAP